MKKKCNVYGDNTREIGGFQFTLPHKSCVISRDITKETVEDWGHHPIVAVS
jgi:hypothetical protein